MGVIFGAALTLALLGQSRSWIPPDSRLGDVYAQTVKRLLGTHIGDPRGGKYMRVQVKLEGIGCARYGEWKPNPKNLYAVEGWLLPGNPKRAVLWDGLEYPVERVLGDGDIERAKRTSVSGFHGYQWFDLSTPGEYHRGLFEQANPVVAALWLLLGEVGVAERSAKQTGDALAAQIRPWLISRYRTHAFYAIRTGRDRVALEWLERAESLSKELEIESPYFEWNPLASLLADVRTRLARKPPTTDLAVIRALPPSERVEALIQALPEVDRLFGDRGAGHPILKEILEQGPAAIPPLIDLLKVNDRFTRVELQGGNMAGIPLLTPIGTLAQSLLGGFWPQWHYYSQLSAPEMKAVYEHQRTLPWHEQLAEAFEDQRVSTMSIAQALRYLGDVSPWQPIPYRQARAMALAKVHARMAKAAVNRATNAVRAFESNGADAAWEEMSHMTAGLATWDYDLGRIHLLKSLELLLSLLPKKATDNYLRGEVQMAIALGLKAEDASIIGHFETYCKLDADKRAWMDIAGLASLAPTNQRVLDALRTALEPITAIMRNDTDPRPAFIELRRLFQYDLSGRIAARPFRSLLATALSNEAYEIAEGGPVYKLPNDQAGVHISPNRRGPKFIHVGVGDYCALLLIEKFHPDLPYDLLASDEIRRKQRNALKDWLRGLPNKPLPEVRVPGPIRKVR